MNDRIPLQSDKVEESKPVAQTPQVTGGKSTDSIFYNRMSDFFELDGTDRKDPKVEEKVNELTEWGKKNGEDRLLVMTAIRQLKMSLGIAHTGKALVDKLHKYITIDKKIKDLEKEAELL